MSTYNFTITNFLKQEGETELRSVIEAALNAGEIKKTDRCVYSNGQASYRRGTNSWTAARRYNFDDFVIYIGSKRRYRTEGTRNLCVEKKAI